MKKTLTFIAAGIFLLTTGFIVSPGLNNPTVIRNNLKTISPTGTIQPDKVIPTSTRTKFPSSSPTIQTPTMEKTAGPDLTLTAVANLTPGPTGKPVKMEAGAKVTVPILLYHHIAENKEDIRYYVSPRDFRIQIAELKKLGYSTITISTLVNVINQGGELPARPVIITFDDGDDDVYLNAYPVLKEFGMVGVFYLVTNRINLPGFVSKEQINDLYQAGWEIGSHSMTHIDLKKDANLSFEMYQSRLRLESELGIPIRSFAYPLGSADSFIMKKAAVYGYESAVGLGEGFVHSKNNIYYLSRLEIRHSTSLEKMIKMLPWKTP